MAPKIGEELEKALSGREGSRDSVLSRKILLLSQLSMHPCLTSTGLANLLNTSERGVMWHMDALIKQEIFGRYEAGKSRFFIRGFVREGDCPVFALLSDERIRSLIMLLEGSPGMSQSEMCSETGLSRQTTRHILEDMEDVGILKAVKEGRNRRYYLTGLLASLKAEYYEKRHSAGKILMERLSDIAGAFDIVLERDGILNVSVGKEDVILSEDPFESAFTG